MKYKRRIGDKFIIDDVMLRVSAERDCSCCRGCYFKDKWEDCNRTDEQRKITGDCNLEPQLIFVKVRKLNDLNLKEIEI